MPDAKPWDRQKGETVKAYTAFDFYRQLGPSRSVAAAYRLYRQAVERADKGRAAGGGAPAGGAPRPPGTPDRPGPPQGSRDRAPGYFDRWAVRWNWRERAAAWDKMVLDLSAETGLDQELKERAQSIDLERQERELRLQEARALRTAGRAIIVRLLGKVDAGDLDAFTLERIKEVTGVNPGRGGGDMSREETERKGLLELAALARELLDTGQKLERVELGQPSDIVATVTPESARAIARLIERFVPVEHRGEVADRIDRVLAGESDDGTD